MRFQQFPFYGEHSGVLAPEQKNNNKHAILKGIGLLAQLGVHDFRIESDGFVEMLVRFGGEFKTIRFHTLNGFYRSVGEDKPIQSITLFFQIKSEDGENIFARVVVPNVNEPQVCKVFFSAVPFGLNGRPEFPNRRSLRTAARIVLTEKPIEGSWFGNNMAKRIAEVKGVAFTGITDSITGCELLQQLTRLQICGRTEDKVWTCVMSPEAFTGIFGLSLDDLKE